MEKLIKIIIHGEVTDDINVCFPRAVCALYTNIHSTRSSIMKKLSLVPLFSIALTACGGGGGDSSPQEETAPPPPPPANIKPTVKAGTDVSINEQQLTALSANATDSDGSIVSYSWTQTVGDSVSLTGVDKAELSFTSPTLTEEAALTFEVTVTDDDGASAKDSVVVTVLPVNIAPVADAGAEAEQTTWINPEALTSLNASLSSDEDGDIVSYQWSQSSGTTVELTNPDSMTATFTPALETQTNTLGFSLTVTDNEGAEHSDNVNVYINQYPVAAAGEDAIVETGREITLNGDASTDDGAISNYLWEQVSGEEVTLTNVEMSQASFTSNFSDDQTIVLSLTITDDLGLYHKDEIQFDIVKINRFINDTGVTFSGDAFSGNDASCPEVEGISQDCHSGRDAQASTGYLTKVGTGMSGFDYSKTDVNGVLMNEDAATWSCVVDNFTGLIWEVKTTDNGVHDKMKNYQWGGKGAIGYDNPNKQGTYFNTWNELVDDANNNTFCGKTNWRLPTVEELAGLVNKSQSGLSVDINYFPNTLNQRYWTANPVHGYDAQAWVFDFREGFDSPQSRSSYNYIRLVAEVQE